MGHAGGARRSAIDLSFGGVLDGSRGRYRLLAEHGRGGFGVAYRGVREGDGAPVLVKVLRLDRLPRWKALELFEREASVLRGLAHPRIPRLLDDVSLVDPPGFALVMELMAAARSGGRSGTGTPSAGYVIITIGGRRRASSALVRP